MKEYIATFYTHLSALRSHRALTAAAIKAAMSPVPRSLSSSCGTCVRYIAKDSCHNLLDADFEQVVEVTGPEQYKKLYDNE